MNEVTDTRPILDRLASRKFIIAMFALIAISVLTGMKIMEIQLFSDLLKIILAGYAVVNVGQKLTVDNRSLPVTQE